MKNLLVTLAILSVGAQAWAKNDGTCATINAQGETCENLKVEFDLKKCSSAAKPKQVKIKCQGDKATATLETEKLKYKTDLQRYVGKQNNAVWVAVGDVSAAETEKTAKRKVAEEPTAEKPEPAPAPVTNSPMYVPPPPPPTEKFVPSWKTSALLQFWYLEDSSAASVANATNFRTRRAEIKFSGAGDESSRWFLSADFAKSLSTTKTTVVTATTPATTTTSVTALNTNSDNKVLQDLGIALKIAPDLEIIFGQFKVQGPTESLQSTGDLLFAERSLLARTYGERRDAGAALAYKTENLKSTLMISNGQGANLDDKDNTKDMSARIDAKIVGVSLGAFALAKNIVADNLERYGFNLGYANSTFEFKAELVNGNSGTQRSTALVIDSSYKLAEHWQLATRYDSLRPNTQTEFISSSVVIGVNHYILKHNLKLQLNHSQLFNMTGSNGSYSSSANQKGSLITFAVQSSF